MRKSQIISLLSICLLIFGLVMVGSSSVVDAARDFSDKWYYLKLQSTWALIGLVAFFFASNFPHQKLSGYSPLLFLLTAGLLLIVLLPGIGVKLLGARRWINFGFLSVQPSEVAKLTLGIYFSHLLSKHGFYNQFIFSLGLILALIILQPDMGTAIIITLMSLITYFGSGGRISKLILLGLCGLALVAILIIVSPYRLSRLTTFLDYSRDPQGAAYQINQAIIGLGSGGIFGVGLGQSRQKYDYLPEASTDSIFAIIGEELGLVGTVGLVLVFFIFVLYGLDIARSSPPGFSANLALAMTSVIAVQSFINISSLTALTPLTGVTLPFISYGGSSLVTSLAAAGILVNISKKYDR